MVPSHFDLGDVDETLSCGEAMGRTLGRGDIVALVGGLGLGKTHLVKGIVRGVGSAAAVSSPTFTLVHEYDGGRLRVFHFDFYRLERVEEVPALGWDEYLDREGVVVVEWADRFPGVFPLGTQWWKLEMMTAKARRLTRLDAPGETGGNA